MKKILALIMSVCLLSSFMSVYAEDTDYINEDDPMTYRNSVDFFEDEDGNICEEAGIAVESMNSLKQDQLIHQDRFSGTTKRIGIDVSEWQKSIDWNVMKDQGVEFAIIRVGYRGYVSAKLVEDSQARKNLEGAKAAGIRVGVYFYSKALNESEARQEADFIKNVVGNTSLDLPVFMDVEYDGEEDRLWNASLSNERQTSIVCAFIDECARYGYSAGIYASANVLKKRMNADEIADKGYVWLAHWTDDTNYSGRYNFWQYNGSAGGVVLNGAYGALDTDVWYDDGTVFNNIATSVDMYRVYNPNSGEHFYTSDVKEKDHIVSVGWKYEGIGWYSADPNDSSSIPVLREYNPNAFANNHNYTKNVEEHNMLMRVGWKDEGKAWYAVG